MLHRLRFALLDPDSMRVSELPGGSEVFSCSFESSHDHYARMAVNLKPVPPAAVLGVDAGGPVTLLIFLLALGNDPFLQ